MPQFITYRLIQFRDVLGRFTKASQEARDLARDFARQGGRLLVAELKRQAPVGTHYEIHDDGTVTESRPETLKKSIKFRTFNRSWGVEIRFYAAEHAKFVIAGTRAHRIAARVKKCLRFFWPNAPLGVVTRSGVVHFRSVWHPGQKKNEFNLRALKEANPELHRLLQKHAGIVKRTLEI